MKDIAIQLAREAGGLIVAGRAGDIAVENTKSSSVDIVTAVDKASEELLFSRLEKLRPNDGFLGEEGRSKDSISGTTWVVDPIDGTVNFFYNIPHYAVSIAAVSGDPVPGSWIVEAAVVYNPVTNEMFHASRGEGAFLGDKQLRIAEPPSLDQALLGTGFAYSEAMRREQARVLVDILPQFRDIRRQGTASLDFAYVASSRLDLYYERTLMPWDHAAGELLVTEAGGVIDGLAGMPAGREGIFAGHPELVSRLQELLHDLGADGPLSDVPGWGLDS